MPPVEVSAGCLGVILTNDDGCTMGLFALGTWWRSWDDEFYWDPIHPTRVQAVQIIGHARGLMPAIKPGSSWVADVDET